MRWTRKARAGTGRRDARPIAPGSEDLAPDLRAVGERLRAASRPVPRDPAFTARLRAELLLAHRGYAAPPPRRPRARRGRQRWRLALLAALLAAVGGGIAAAGILAPSPAPGTVLTGRGPILRITFVGQTAAALAVDGRTGRAFVVTQGNLIRGAFPLLVVRVLDTATGMFLRTVPLGTALGAANAVAVDSHVGHVFVAQEGARTGGADVVSMLDARSGAVLRRTMLSLRPPARTAPGTVLARATMGVDERTGRAFITIPGNNAVAVFDTHSGALVRTIGVGLAPGALAVDARRGRVVVANEDDGTVSLLDARSGQLLRTVAVGPSPTAVAIDARTGHAFVALRGAPDRRGVLTLGRGHVAVLDVGTGQLLRTVAVRGTPSDVAVAAGMGHVFVVGAAFSGDGRVSMLDAATGRVLRTSTVGAYPYAVAVVARSGEVFITTMARPGVVSAHPDSAVSVLDARTGRVTRTVRAGPGLLSPGPLAVDERRGQVFIANEGAVTVLDAAP